MSSDGPVLAASVTLKFDPSTKYGPEEAAFYSAANADAFLNVGNAADSARRAQGFRIPASSRVVQAGLWLKKIGVPGDSLTVEIQTDAGGLPSDAVIANGTSNTVSGDSLSSSYYKFVTFTFATPPELTEDAQYHLVLSRSGAVDPFGYYQWGADESSPGYADGAASVYDSGTWTATSPDSDHAFGVNRVQIDVVVEGLEGLDRLGAYEVTVAYDPSVLAVLGIHDGGFLGSTGRGVSCLSPVYGSGTVYYKCTTLGSEPAGPTGAGILVTVDFGPVAVGSAALQLVDETRITRPVGTVIAHTRQDGSITIQSLGPATGDSDGDGCSDVEEVGDNIIEGGDRDWLNPWDFYDVPVPARADPTPNGDKNGAISFGDVGAVLFYTGAAQSGTCGDNLNGNGVDYDCDKDEDYVPDGLDYDRSPAPPISGPPDTAIGFSDVGAVLGQAGHTCQGP